MAVVDRRTVPFPGGEISFVLTRKPVKNVNLRVNAKGEVSVSANNRVSQGAIDGFVAAKIGFILAAREKYASLRESDPPPRHMVSGERIALLGESLTLLVEEGGKDGWSLLDGVLRLTLKNPQDEKKRQALAAKFFRHQCEEVFGEISAKIHGEFAPYGIPLPTLKLREMKTRWGSCHPQKALITLNTKLIAAPRPAVEFVILHEYCHFLHPNHSKAFYTALGQRMPDWQARKKELDKIK